MSDSSRSAGIPDEHVSDLVRSARVGDKLMNMDAGTMNRTKEETQDMLDGALLTIKEIKDRMSALSPASALFVKETDNLAREILGYNKIARQLEKPELTGEGVFPRVVDSGMSRRRDSSLPSATNDQAQ